MKITEIATNIAYHITPTANLSEIMKIGLVPKIGSRSSKISNEPRAIYMFPDHTSAEDALANWLGDEFGDEELSLLAVNITGLNIINGANYELLVTDPIAPDRISILNKNY